MHSEDATMSHNITAVDLGSRLRSILKRSREVDRMKYEDVITEDFLDFPTTTPVLSLKKAILPELLVSSPKRMRV
jgi:hypothetical protein